MDLAMECLSPITVFVLDDHELVLRGLIELIDAEPDMAVVGSAYTEREAISGILRTRPDVALLDVRLEEGCGFNVCREVSRQLTLLAPIIFTSVADERVLIEAAACGAVGVCHKADRTDHVIASIRDAAFGVDLIAPRQLEAAIAAAHQLEYPALADLNGCERRIMELIGLGWSNRQIAAEVMLAEKTVKNYVSALFGKLGLLRRAEVAALAGRLAERQAIWNELTAGQSSRSVNR